MELKKGMRFHWLVLIEPIYKFDENRKRKFWKCKCRRCGNICIVREDALLDKHRPQKSCGCYRKYTRYKYLKRNNKLDFNFKKEDK